MSCPESRRGLLYAVLAYLLWGLLPLYWKLLASVPPLEILCHRIAWSLAFTGALLAWRGGIGPALRQGLERRTGCALLGTALLLGVNWLVYIHAVNTGQVLQGSLGYFISPLVSAALGVLFLGERLTPLQVGAFALALAGVLVLALAGGQPPWLALALAGTFALYGLGRKVARLGSLDGLFLESAVLTLPALAWLAWLASRGAGAFGHEPWGLSLLLVGSGVTTSVPLLFFAASARRMPLTTLGLLQYLSPTMQFLLGLLLYREPFGGAQLAAFTLIWTGLALYTWALLGPRARPAVEGA